MHSQATNIPINQPNAWLPRTSLVAVESRVDAIRAQSRAWRRNGEKIAFVPTMGVLHKGHLSLVETARKNGADRVVVSIFVNPTQFGPNEDLAAYPRDLERDLDPLQRSGVDLLFTPSADTIYPQRSQTFVTVEALQKTLCGQSRPGHFRGVSTVVSLLFNIVEPDMAVFGEKDYQQLLVIRQMVQDLHIGVQIIGSPIVREIDGLAMSSRNQYLNPEQRQGATAIFRALRLAKKRVVEGEKCAQRLMQEMRYVIETDGGRVDYVSVVDSSTLRPLLSVSGDSHAMVATCFGATRLIDNMALSSAIDM